MRQRRPDRAVYIPRHRRSLEERRFKVFPANQTTLNEDPNTNNNSRLQDTCCLQQSMSDDPSLDNRICDSRDMEDSHFPRKILEDAVVTLDSKIPINMHSKTEYTHKLLEEELKEDMQVLSEENETFVADNSNKNSANFNVSKSFDKIEINDEPIKMTTQATVREEDRSLVQHLDCNNTVDNKNRQLVGQNVVSDNVLIISDNMRKKSERSEQTSPILVIPPEKKVKKIERQKSKPVPPPSPPIKINRDECDWDSLFDDNGDCLDPTLIEEVSIYAYIFTLKLQLVYSATF